MNVYPRRGRQGARRYRQGDQQGRRAEGLSPWRPALHRVGPRWFFANSITQFWPQYAMIAWLSLLAAGMVASTTIGILQARSGKQEARPRRRTPAVGRKMGMTSGVVFAFISCLMWISRPESNRRSQRDDLDPFPVPVHVRGNLGWLAGCLRSAFSGGGAILIGYFYVKDWFDLWMAVFAGGSLLAGGLWLRSALIRWTARTRSSTSRHG